jgi:hypothetical protein
MQWPSVLLFNDLRIFAGRFSVASEGGSGTPDPDFAIELENIETALRYLNGYSSVRLPI